MASSVGARNVDECTMALLAAPPARRPPTWTASVRERRGAGLGSRVTADPFDGGWSIRVRRSYSTVMPDARTRRPPPAIHETEAPGDRARALATAESRGAPVDPSAVRRVLIVRPRFLGDICLTLPVVEAVRASCPHAAIGYVVERDAAPLLA